MIEIRNLSCGYGGKTVLHDISVGFENHKLTVIVGPNGCGKSTLLKAAIGMIKGCEAAVTVDDKPLSVLHRTEIARSIGYLSQSQRVPDMTAEQLVLHGRFAHLSYPRIYREQDRRIAVQAMRTMGVWEYAETPLAELSGGMRQNVYLAMLLCSQTDHLLMDEPTTYLDIAAKLSLMRQARSLADAGKAVVMVLHDLPLGLQFADTVYVMREGRIWFYGTPEQVYASGVTEQVFGVPIRYSETDKRYYY